jgi:hypothetical protein
VLQRRWPNPALPQQWFRLLDDEQPVLVGPCGHFFEAEEYEMVRGTGREILQANRLRWLLRAVHCLHA